MLITLQTKNHPSSIVFSRNARTRQLKHLNLDLRLLNNLHLPLAHPDRPTGVIAPEHLTLTPAATAVQMMIAMRLRTSRRATACRADTSSSNSASNSGVTRSMPSHTVLNQDRMLPVSKLTGQGRSQLGGCWTPNQLLDISAGLPASSFKSISTTFL